MDAIAAIEQFTAGIELEVFSGNLEKIFAVSRAKAVLEDVPQLKAMISEVLADLQGQI